MVHAAATDPTFLQAEKRLAALPRLDCAVCSVDLDAIYTVFSEVTRLNSQALRLAAAHPQGLRTFSSGRLVILHLERDIGTLALILRSASAPSISQGSLNHQSDHDRSFWVLALQDATPAAQEEGT